MPAAQPSAADREAFLADAAKAVPGLDAGDDQRVRCTGWDDETSTNICNLIIQGEKTGTFSLPWLHAKNPDSRPQIGEYIIQTTFDGKPQALLQTRALELVTFGDIDASYTALDGPSVRDVEVWRGIHTKHWNGLLEPHGMAVAEDMPVVVEKFACVYPKG